MLSNELAIRCRDCAFEYVVRSLHWWHHSKWTPHFGPFHPNVSARSRLSRHNLTVVAFFLFDNPCIVIFMKYKLKRLRGIIIHRSAVREKDIIIEAYTREEGRVSFFAPGIRHTASRRAGHLETLMETSLVLVQSKRGSSLSEARVINTFPRLRADYDRLETIFEIVKMLRHYTGEGQGDAVLYDVVLSCLRIVDNEVVLPKFIEEIVAVQLLRHLGTLPDLYACSRCRKKLVAGDFSLRASDLGFWCNACGGKKDVALTDLVKIIRIFLLGKENMFKLKISDTNLRRLRQITQGLLRA